MKVNCPRCNAEVEIDEADADDQSRVRLRCAECNAKILIRVNRPELKVDEATPRPARRLHGLDGISIERADETGGAKRSLRVAHVPEDCLPDFRAGLKGTEIYGNNPNKLNWVLSEPPYVLEGLSIEEATEIEAWVQEVGGQLASDDDGDSDELMVVAGADDSADETSDDGALIIAGDADDTAEEDLVAVEPDEPEPDIAADLAAAMGTAPVDRVAETTPPPDASDDDVSVEAFDDPDASLVPFHQLDADKPVTTQNRLEGLDRVLGLVSAAVRVELIDIAGPDPAGAIENALDEAKDRLLLRAAELGADGVVAVRMHQGSLGTEAWVVVLTGTAVSRG